MSLIDLFKLDDDLDWMLRAACAGTDNPDLWFPARGDSTATARAVCRRCPVRTDCLDWALTNNERFGIWGGKGERERRAMRRATRETAA